MSKILKNLIYLIIYDRIMNDMINYDLILNLVDCLFEHHILGVDFARSLFEIFPGSFFHLPQHP